MMSYFISISNSNSSSKIETLLHTFLAVMLAVPLFVFYWGFVFLSFQISDFAEDFDKIERNINIHLKIFRIYKR
jgi:hypothetical protein